MRCFLFVHDVGREKMRQLFCIYPVSDLKIEETVKATRTYTGRSSIELGKNEDSDLLPTGSYRFDLSL